MEKPRRESFWRGYSSIRGTLYKTSGGVVEAVELGIILAFELIVPFGDQNMFILNNHAVSWLWLKLELPLGTPSKWR